ncbi:MAG: type II secretion system F family protein [Thermodesulfovibrionales bacterium]|nr:type II secretion system F family protein [Thermodesulfovibrionales bacterium]
MPIFRYSGYRTNGRDVSGVIEASGRPDVAARLKAEGIFPSEIAESVVRARKGIFRRVDENFLPYITRQLSLLLSTGVPLIDALSSISYEKKGFYRDMLVAIKEKVTGGASLHRALEEYSDYFPEFYTGMIQSGEESGNLDKVLAGLADFLEGQNDLRAKVRSAMVYPMFMAGVSIVVISFLFTFVMPKMVRIFDDMRASLPFITIALIKVSHIFINYWWAITGGAVGLFLLLKRFFRRKRVLFGKIMLKLPGNIIQNLYYARFARTLGFLIEGGMPILRALKFSSKAVGNRAMELSIMDSERKVAEGQRLSASLTDFSPVFLQVVATGEKSGKLSVTLLKAADAYEEEFKRRVSRAVAVLEPAMILFMGLVVSFIVMAVLLPMFQLNQLIK